MNSYVRKARIQEVRFSRNNLALVFKTAKGTAFIPLPPHYGARMLRKRVPFINKNWNSSEWRNLEDLVGKYIYFQDIKEREFQDSVFKELV